MTSPLERLAGPGQPLAAEPPDAKELAGLKRSGLARLRDAANSSNSLDEWLARAGVTEDELVTQFKARRKAGGRRRGG
jgi:hypothetical protein